MTALMLLAVLAADHPADAPTVDQLAATGDFVHLEQGEFAHTALSCLTDAAFVASEQQAREDHELVKSVRPGGGYTILPTWSVVAIVSAAVLTSVAVTVGVMKATEKRP